MSEITCPHCHPAFQVDESGYAEILRQVRDEATERLTHGNPTMKEKFDELSG